MKKGVNMKTQFKVFKSTWGYHTMEDLIKEYQEEHHLEIKDIMLIRNSEDKPMVIITMYLILNLKLKQCL